MTSDEDGLGYVDLPSPPEEPASPGKERGKHNALKHGIFSRRAVLAGEIKWEFDDLFNGLREDFEPKGTLELVLVEKLATLFWRYRRLIAAEGAGAKVYACVAVVEDSTRMDRLLRYEASLDRSLDRTLKQLERLQRIRLGLAVPPSVDVNISS